MAGILLIGQDRGRASGIGTLLREDGHEVTWHRTVDEWHLLERDLCPELVVATTEAQVDAVLRRSGRRLRGFPAPLLLVQQEPGLTRDPFAEDRLIDRLVSPFLREELLGRVDALIRVRRVIHHRSSREPDEVEHRSRPTAGTWRRLTAKMTTFLRGRMPVEERPQAPYQEVAARLADWADRRDAFEPGHAERVTSFCGIIAERLGMGPEETSCLLRAAMLHDIGKAALPIEVLRQERPLEENQLRMIRTHPRRGAALLRALDPDDEAAEAVLYHHECPDGSGYYGRQPEQTPRTARVLHVAECYDAMITSRVKNKLSRDEALERLDARKGQTLDADCVEALVNNQRRHRRSIPLVTR